MTDSFTGDGDKVFRVASVKNKKISPEVEQRLKMAYQAQYGTKTACSRVEIRDHEDGTWLWFEGARKGSPTFAIKLKMEKGSYTIDFGAPLGINNCLTTDSCSQCKIPCGCGRNGGGGSCVEKKTDKVTGFGRFAEKLTSY